MSDGDAETSFRRAMGAFATGVAVVTASRADGATCGITVNSLTSVSLRPRLLLWCLGDRSERYEMFAAAEVWGVSILPAGEEAVARRFAIAERELLEQAERAPLGDAPVLEGALARFACRTRARIPAGDHLVIIGEVTAFDTTPGAALTFFRGRYGRTEDAGG